MHYPVRAGLLCGLFCMFVFSVAAQNPDGWIFKGEKEAVKVYYRKTSDIYELKLATSIKVSLSGIASLLDDVEKYPVWGYKIPESRMLKRVSATEFYYYTRIDFPWPLNDRDLILHTVMEQNPANHAVVFTSTSVPDYMPELEDAIRIRKTDTKWTVIPGAGGWMYVEYYLNSDPGGQLPDWVVNMALDYGPRETIKRMREVLRDPMYQNTKLAHIKE